MDNWVSLDEVRRHNKKSDCWIIISGIVYDVTKWVDSHPGGDLVCALAGEDVTALFYSSHLRCVTQLLAKYKVGHIGKHSPEFDLEQDEFLRVLQQRVMEHFQGNRISYRHTRLLRRQLLVSLVAFALCWYATYYLGSWLATVIMGLISCAMVGGFAHEHCHDTLTASGNQKKKLVSVGCSLIWATLFPFMPEKHFQYEHLRHHISPMDARLDYEVYAIRSMVRLSHNLEHRWFHVFQKYYAPVIYSFYITAQTMGGFFGSYFDGRNLSKDKAYRLEAWCAPIVMALIHVALPVHQLGWLDWLKHFVVYNAIWQGATYYVAAVVHMTEPMDTASRCWSYRVCYYTKNVLCGNLFYDWLSGGFNYQIEHHLLPGIAREYLPMISPIVVRTCREFGYPYREYRSFAAYFRDHLRFLDVLGQKKNFQSPIR